MAKIIDNIICFLLRNADICLSFEALLHKSHKDIGLWNFFDDGLSAL